MAEPVLDLQGFAARLVNGPAFLLLGRSADPDESAAAQYRWSGIYMTRTDAAVAARFRADWRTIVPVGAMSSTPSRSQTELEICYLFGGQDLPEAQRPPTDPLQMADARMRCVQELTRLVTETVTPRGVVVIEGWAPDDELAVTDLVPALRSLGAHSYRQEIADTDLIRPSRSGEQPVARSCSPRPSINSITLARSWVRRAGAVLSSDTPMCWRCPLRMSCSPRRAPAAADPVSVLAGPTGSCRAATIW